MAQWNCMYMCHCVSGTTNSPMLGEFFSNDPLWDGVDESTCCPNIRCFQIPYSG